MAICKVTSETEKWQFGGSCNKCFSFMCAHTHGVGRVYKSRDWISDTDNHLIWFIVIKEINKSKQSIIQVGNIIMSESGTEKFSVQPTSPKYIKNANVYLKLWNWKKNKLLKIYSSVMHFFEEHNMDLKYLILVLLILLWYLLLWKCKDWIALEKIILLNEKKKIKFIK